MSASLLRTGVLAAACALLFTAPAAAQPRKRAPARPAPPVRADRYVSVSAGIQPAGSDLKDTARFQLHAENATVEATYPGKHGVLVDGGFGMRLWKRLGAGVSVSYRTSDTTMTVTGSLPHPFFLDRPRALDGDMAGVRRAETGVHVQALYFLPMRGRWRVVLSGGPTFFSAEHEMADPVRYNDDYPHDEVSFRTQHLRRFSTSAVGFNAGADITYRVGRRFGVGGVVRYAGASTDFEGPERRRIDLDVGGFQAGAGVRIFF